MELEEVPGKHGRAGNDGGTGRSADLADLHVDPERIGGNDGKRHEDMYHLRKAVHTDEQQPEDVPGLPGRQDWLQHGSRTGAGKQFYADEGAYGGRLRALGAGFRRTETGFSEDRFS